MSDQNERLDAGDASSGEGPFSIPPELPILPLRDTVLFPNSFMPLAVARETSVRLIDDAIVGGKLVGIFTQRDASVEEPGQEDLYQIGTATHVHKMFKLPDGGLRLIVQGLARVRLDRVISADPYLRAEVSPAVETTGDEDHLEIDALERNIKSNFQHVISLSPLLSDDLQTLTANISDPGKLADFIASSLTTITTLAKQEVLQALNVRGRMDHLNRVLIKELEVLELGSKIQSQVQSEVGKGQREYLLREQLKAIQRELGESDEQAKEMEELREKIEAVGMPETVQKEALRELDRLSRMPVAAAEYTVSRTYVDWLVALPWAKRTEEVIDLMRTKAVLDADHSDLEKAKDRILEYLAVRKLNPKIKGPILCFVGPPGVGKTSLAKSIATALDRKYVRVSLGGMRDEAEIRGHRRTYIGALPGQVIQGLRRAESKNPVFILDEIDKLGSDFRGDPASALLEVPRSRAKQHVQGSLPRRPIRSLRGVVYHDRQRARPGRARAPRPHGGARAPRIHGRGKAQHCAGAPCGQTGDQPRVGARADSLLRSRSPVGHPWLYTGGGCQKPRARDRRGVSKGSRGGAPKDSKLRWISHLRPSWRCSALRASSWKKWRNGRRSPAWRSAWLGRPRAAMCCSWKRGGCKAPGR